MKIGPKYKIARRLGAQVFEKTQGAKFALAMQKKNKRFAPRPKSGFGQQLLEKQRVRYTYAIAEKQFAKYVREIIEKKPTNSSEALFQKLEKRLDSIVLRAGLAPTRLAARQMVSHGHILVNDRKVTIPSMQITSKDKISIKQSSKDKPLFAALDERLKEHSAPAWISFDSKKGEISLKGEPVYSPSESQLDLLSVLQFYKR